MQTDPSTVLKVSAICGASYGAQMGLAADTFEPVYYKSGSGRSASWEWFGHAISGGSLIQAAAASKLEASAALVVGRGARAGTGSPGSSADEHTNEYSHLHALTRSAQHHAHAT